MTRKCIFWMLLLFSCCANGQPARKISPAASGRPNIIIIMADDMGYSDLGCFGGEIRTPHIDQLAMEGIRFTQMYTNAWCSPSRASLLTGLYPQQAGMGLLAEPRTGPPGPYEGYLNRHCVTLAEVLKSAGYYTALSGKWHLGDSSIYWPVQRGFDHSFGLISGAANYFDIRKGKAPDIRRKLARQGKLYTPPAKGFYMTDAITDDALQVLKAQKAAAAPFFLYVAYTAPHWPLQALKKDIARYKGKYDIGWDTLRQRRFQRQQQLGIVSSGDKLSPRDPEVPKWEDLSGKGKKEMAQKMAVYAAQVDRMDQGVGRILRQLNRIGKAQNTLVIFLSDNGGCAEGGLQGFDKRKNGLPPGSVDTYMSYGQSWANVSNTPFRYYKRSLLEGGISDPMIVRWPAVIGGERSGSIVKQVAHLIDIMPTVCEITGASYPLYYKGENIYPAEGQSLILQLTKGQRTNHRPIYWSLEQRKAVICGDYKLESANDKSPFRLYDLSVDRGELNDLASEMPEKVQAMKLMWWAWAKKVDVFNGRPKNRPE